MKQSVSSQHLPSCAGAPMDALSSLATDRDSFVAQRSKPDREIRKDVRCKVRPVVIAVTERKWEGRTQSRGLDEQRFGVEQLDEAEHLDVWRRCCLFGCRPTGEISGGSSALPPTPEK